MVTSQKRKNNNVAKSHDRGPQVAKTTTEYPLHL